MISNQKQRQLQKVSLLLAFSVFFQAVFPVSALALTGGPTQPEMHGFQPVGTSDLVDLFTGDFSYNIPIMDVGGYPINLAYASDVGMEEEASWVGLGWSLTPGAINRSVRGLPDDFKGDEITRQYNIKPNLTTGITAGVSAQLLGWFGLQGSLGVNYNNYSGYGFEFGLSPTVSIGINNSDTQFCTGKTSSTSGQASGGFSISAGLNFSSQQGLSIRPSIGVRGEMKKRDFSATLALNHNSRQGYKDFSFGAGLTRYALNEAGNRIGQKGYARNLSGGITLGASTYFPAPSMPLENLSLAFNGTVGSEVFGAHPNFDIGGYSSAQALAFKEMKSPAYGYLNAQHGEDELSALHDFNEEAHGMLIGGTPKIPLGYGTYDQFSYSGQGIGGSFRALRNDIGVFYPSLRKNTSASGSVGIELGAGNTIHVGVDVQATAAATTVTKWEKDNFIKDVLPFTEEETTYESAFFRDASEIPVSVSSLYDQLEESQTLVTEVEAQGSNLTALSNYLVKENKQSVGEVAVTSDLKESDRQNRNTVFSILTAKEASQVGLEKTINDYPQNSLSHLQPGTRNTSVNSLDRTRYAEHHISEITTTRSDGARYVYGLPAYNVSQQELTFSIEPTSSEIASATNPNHKFFGTVPYSTVDASVDNQKGKDNYFDGQTIPAYAHSYLLTAVLSPDYQDRTGDGITDDDVGTAHKLNYSLIDENYKWRATLAEGYAIYHPGNLSSATDDKASIVYGEKEIWSLHSIESRNMVALFYTSLRKDAYGVESRQGAVADSSKLVQLDSIALFSKSDIIANGSNAIPIKTAHFDYIYELCTGVPNTAPGTTGKLTLDKVYFTYGASNKGKLNAYSFHYKKSYNGVALEYRNGNVDRWGFAQKNPTDYANNFDFPYTAQDTATVNTYSGAWNLNRIELPSGGEINITYESDDYAYLQDHRAGQMHFITGFSASADYFDSGLTASLYKGESNDYEIQKYIAIDIPYTSESLTEIKKRYLEDVGEDLYYKCLVELDGTTAGEEYLSGYLDINLSGVVHRDSAGASRLYIPVEEFTIDNGTTLHPITVAALQKLRLELPELAYPGYDNSDANYGEAFIQSLVGMGNEIKNLFKGFEKNSLKKGWGKRTILNKKSWVRLANPTFQKYGGGTRVKELRLSDGWDITNGGGISSYGQKYTYTTTVPGVNGGAPISSGVASYEPMLGGEENLMRTPLPYPQDVKGAPSNYYYAELPAGENLFPSPQVGYSEVRVESIHAGTGHSISEFYTAKDFPVKWDLSKPEPAQRKFDPIINFFKLRVQDFLALSQGLSVEVNDMHGRAKSQSTYDASGALLSSTTYSYQVKDIFSDQPNLDSEVSLVGQDGSIETGRMGIEMDVWQTMQEDETTSASGDISANFDGFFFGPFFIPLVIPIPFVQTYKTQVRLSSTVKLVKRFGILDKVTVVENGASLTTENLLYDKETGQVLLTKTENEFGDPIYNFTYPAHWAYEEMECAYQNIGAVYSDLSVSNGAITSGMANPATELTLGDELVVMDLSDSTILPNRYYVTQPTPPTVRLMNEAGQLLNPSNNVAIRVIRSGKRNQAGMPIGSISSRNNPIQGSSLVLDNTIQVLTAEAMEYSDQWETECESNLACGPTFDFGTVNIYAAGLAGNMRPKASFTFINDRNPASLTSSTNIKEDGAIVDFFPYWDFTTAKLDPINHTTELEWQIANEITRYDRRGNEVENKDPLGIYSAATFGYNTTLTTAVAANAAKYEIAFDGFEDYFFSNSCDDYEAQRQMWILDGFSSISGLLTDSISHSGLFSLDLDETIDSIRFFVPTIASNNGCEEYANPGYNTTNGGTQFGTNCNSCMPGFVLEEHQEYLVSAWVADDSSLQYGLPLDSSVAVQFLPVDIDTLPCLTFGSSRSTVTPLASLYPSGPVIDGWQRIYGKVSIDIPTGGIDLAGVEEFILMSFSKIGHRDKVYFDDFRIQPWLANMNTYVYNPNTLRLMATQDENNYSTFYEYDEEGILIRTKRETERGIMTIQEGRTQLSTNNN